MLNIRIDTDLCTGNSIFFYISWRTKQGLSAVSRGCFNVPARTLRIGCQSFNIDSDFWEHEPGWYRRFDSPDGSMWLTFAENDYLEDVCDAIIKEIDKRREKAKVSRKATDKKGRR